MNLKITPGKLSGDVLIPPSKSIAHRAIIAAALAEGKSRIYNIDFSEDITATLKGMEALGAKVNITEDYIEIDGTNTLDKTSDHSKIIINCIESGSTLRFLIPLALLKDEFVNFIGTGNLGKRPLDTYYRILDSQNIYYSNSTTISEENSNLDLTVKGKLQGGQFIIPGNVSSQFITGLLFTLPLINEDSQILIEGNLESRGYVDLTLEVLKDYGVEIINDNYSKFIIKGKQKFIPKDFKVEGDFSQGAFFLVANSIGNDINCSGLNMKSSQGDRKIVQVIEEIEKNEERVIDASQIPDLVPIITVLASMQKGTTKIINAGRLRIKECDRLKAISSELNKIGGKVQELEDSLIIEGVSNFTGGQVWSFKDHRIAMSLAIASTRCVDPLIIEDSQCVKKSYPDFWNDFEKIGGVINEWNLG